MRKVAPGGRGTSEKWLVEAKNFFLQIGDKYFSVYKRFLALLVDVGEEV